jgi:glycosyltransferase involved in cell wall biosynthesis
LYCGREAISIAAAIERLARDPGLRERLGQQARLAVHERFSLERYCSGVLSVYQRILN